MRPALVVLTLAARVVRVVLAAIAGRSLPQLVAGADGREGLYRRARAGEIADFTGITAPYEPPDKPDLVVDTANQSIDECVESIVAHVDLHFALRP